MTSGSGRCKILVTLVITFKPKGYDKKAPAKITKKLIEKHARPGESYKQVELRLKAETS